MSDLKKLVSELEALPDTQAKDNLIRQYMLDEMDVLTFIKKAGDYVEAHTLIGKLDALNETCPYCLDGTCPRCGGEL